MGSTLVKELAGFFYLLEAMLSCDSPEGVLRCIKVGEGAGFIFAEADDVVLPAWGAGLGADEGCIEFDVMVATHTCAVDEAGGA